MFRVVVPEPPPLGFAEPQSVDQARMDELVGQNQVALARQSRQDARVDQIARSRDQRRAAAEEFRQGRLESRIVGTVAGDEPRRGVAQQKSPVVGLPLHEFPVGVAAGESQIVVRRQVQVSLAVADDVFSSDFYPRQFSQVVFGPEPFERFPYHRNASSFSSSSSRTTARRPSSPRSAEWRFTNSSVWLFVTSSLSSWAWLRTKPADASG